jgi:hypothetical protein
VKAGRGRAIPARGHGFNATSAQKVAPAFTI